jgi:hypothetical protein
MMHKQLVAAAAILACLSGSALADTINLSSAPGTDTFTATSISFTGLGSIIPPISGSYFTSFLPTGCTGCTSFSPTTMTSGGGTEVFTIVNDGVTDTIDLTSYTFTGDSRSLTITGFGTSLLSSAGAVLTGIAFTLTTQLTSTQGNGATTSYSGTITTTPLPPAWTMLFASLLGLGFMAYRGSKKQASAFSMA